MAMYSLIQLISTFLTEIYLQYPADFQFVYFDLVLNFAMVVFVGYTPTAPRLSIERPRSTLFSFTNIIQILVMFFLQAAGQALSLFIYQWV